MPRKSRLVLPPIKITNKNIGNRLAYFRKANGFTQIKLAKKMGIIQTLVSAYETGQIKLTAEMIIRFSKALRVSSDDILNISRNNIVKKILSLKITRRMKRIEKLPYHRQMHIFQMIDILTRVAERSIAPKNEKK